MYMSRVVVGIYYNDAYDFLMIVLPENVITI